MKSYKKWHPRIFLNITLTSSIVAFGLGVLLEIQERHDWSAIFLLFGAIQGIGVPYFWQQRNDSDEDWK